MDFAYDPVKDDLLVRTRGVSFLDAIAAIQERGALLDFDHPNQGRYPGQRIMVVDISGYAYCVPYHRSETVLHLKTLYPNRRFKYLIKEES